MKKRKLGKSELEVSVLGFGCMGLNYAYSHTIDKKESIALLLWTPTRPWWIC